MTRSKAKQPDELANTTHLGPTAKGSKAKQPDEFVDTDWLTKRYGVTKWCIHQWMKRGEFVTPLRLGRRMLRWKLREILAWEDTRVGLEPIHATPAEVSKTG